MVKQTSGQGGLCRLPEGVRTSISKLSHLSGLKSAQVTRSEVEMEKSEREDSVEIPAKDGDYSH